VKILFIYPYEQAVDNHNYEFHRITEHAVQFNFAIAMLSAVLKKNGHEVALLPLFSEESQSEIVDDKLDWAEIFAFSISEAEIGWTVKLSECLRKQYPNKKQVAGGVGPTLNPEMILEDSKIDVVCVGEGEYALPQLLKKLEGNEDICGINNLFVKHNGTIVKSDIGEVVEDLDSLPMYDYDLFDEFPLKHLQSNMPRLYYLATRNCMFNCSFCANGRKKLAMGIAKSRKYVRRFSPQRVVTDLLELRERYPQAKVVHFNDEIIHADAKWFKEFTYLYRERFNLPWRSYASLATINEETIHLMSLSNCYRVNVGIEAGSQRIRDEIYKRPYITNEEMIHKMQLLKAHGIGIHASSLFGAPTETLDEMFETLMINAKGDVDILIAGIVVPYRNTELYEICLKLNKLGNIEYNNRGVSIVPNDDILKEQIMFIRQYVVELVKVLQYALSLSEASSRVIIEFVKWVISNPEVDFAKLLELYPIFFRDISNDMAYEKMETKFGRTITNICKNNNTLPTPNVS
jgi:radical SAM superfamily enzyme YgiQ (UPF0313 family)